MPGPLGMYVGSFSANALTGQFYDGSSAFFSVAAGDYYLAGYTGEGAGAFLATVQSGIRAVAGQGNANVSLNVSTGRVTVALNTARAINWTTDRLANILGVSNGLVQPSAATHVGANSARYLWRPSRAPASHPVGITEALSPRSGTVYGRSEDGTTFSVKGSKVQDGTIGYTQLPAADVIRPEGGTVYLDLRQWWDDVVHEGMPFRFVMNRDKYAATSDYKTCIWYEEGEEEVGAFDERIGRTMKSYQGRWDVRVPLAEKK